MSNQSDTTETLNSNLFKHCAEGKTGTISIATNNNKSCQIVLKNGEILAVTMSRLKGLEAVKELLKVGIKRAALNQNLDLPFSEEARIESSDKLLRSLGYNQSSFTDFDPKELKKSNASTETEDIKEAPKRMYRGQIIDD